METMRARPGLHRRKCGRMGIVTRCAVGTDNRPAFAIPKSRSAAVHSYLPIAIVRSVTTAAQATALRELEGLSFIDAKTFQVFRIVTDKAVFVAIIAPMLHDNLFVRFRQNYGPIRIEIDEQLFFGVMTGVAGKA
jgi:hypothetical protein